MTATIAERSTPPTEDVRALIREVKARRKPEVILPSGDTYILDCANQLFPILAKSKRMFLRGGAIQELAADDKGSMTLSIVRDIQFRSRIEEHCCLKKWVVVHGESALKADRCPQQTASALMVSSPAAEHLPHIRGIARCPVIAYPSANILLAGYHPENGGLLITTDVRPNDVPISEAVAYLHGLLDEFDFNTPADRARALAMMITPALCMGGWIKERRPIFTVCANASQSGKGYLLDLLYAVYGEHRFLMGKRDGGVGSLDEDLQTGMLRGQPFIQIDNLRGKLDSQLLERILTADGGSVPCRVPYAGCVDVDPLHFIFTATSNGMDTTDDLANRSCIIRIRNRGKGFRFRQYPEGDLKARVLSNHGLYLGSVFSIVAEWARQGSLGTNESRHHFRAWVQALDWISKEIFGAGPIMDGHIEAQTTISKPALVWLRAVVVEVEKIGKLDTDLNASALAEICEEAESAIEIPNCRSETAEDRRKRIGVIMHKLLPGGESRMELDAYSIARTIRPIYYETAQRWGEEKVYRFSKTAPSPHLPHLPQ